MRRYGNWWLAAGSSRLRVRGRRGRRGWFALGGLLPSWCWPNARTSA